LTGQIDNSMVMKCVAYQNGVSIGDVTIEDISDVLKREHTFVWLGLHEANAALLAKIQEEFGLHDLAIEDACAAHQRPKIEEYGESLFMVLHTAHLAEDQVEFGETHIFLGTAFSGDGQARRLTQPQQSQGALRGHAAAIGQRAGICVVFDHGLYRR